MLKKYFLTIYAVGIIRLLMFKKLKNWNKDRKIRKQWLKRTSGEPVVDWVRGFGYYLPSQLTGEASNEDLGLIQEIPLKSGRTGLYKLLSFNSWTKDLLGPIDSIEESRWQLMGYKGEKLFADMSFEEYKETLERNMKERYG